MKVKDLKRKENCCECGNCKCHEDSNDGIITITVGDELKAEYIYLGEVVVDEKKYFVTADKNDEDTELVVIPQGEQESAEEYKYNPVTDEVVKKQILVKFQQEYDAEEETEYLVVGPCGGMIFGLELFGEVEYAGKKYLVATELFFNCFEVEQNTDELVDYVCDSELEEKILKAFLEE